VRTILSLIWLWLPTLVPITVSLPDASAPSTFAFVVSGAAKASIVHSVYSFLWLPEPIMSVNGNGILLINIVIVDFLITTSTCHHVVQTISSTNKLVAGRSWAYYSYRQCLVVALSRTLLNVLA